MFLKIRRDTLIILLLAFMLIFSGRLISYVSFASSYEPADGVPISGVIIKGNDILPIENIKANVANAGFRAGSYIKGNKLVTSKRTLDLADAIVLGESLAKISTFPGTKFTPIIAANINVDMETGLVSVNVVEDFSNSLSSANSSSSK
ncbi:MAG: hypothetical protein LBV42_04745 [Methanobrevibacter sp.]|jgi:hypothetical protein|nr:hypothetical protein [Methanobrevibacter sp.]